MHLTFSQLLQSQITCASLCLEDPYLSRGCPLLHPDDRSLHVKLQTQALLHSFSCPGPRPLKSSSSPVGIKPSHLAALVPHAVVVPQAGPVSIGHPAHLLQVLLDHHLQGSPLPLSGVMAHRLHRCLHEAPL